jgi:O-acetyl-ADP-ribose deacetylase (regulator of RNase III)
MIEIVHGNLLQANVDALVNTVNTEGVMGKGIALQFRRAYPAMFDAYLADCKAGRVKLGHMHVYDLGGLVSSGPRWIINFPTKGHWKARSRLSDIQSGLTDLKKMIRELGINSIALPPLGCGHGGLSWSDVRPMIELALNDFSDLRALLFAPDGSPAAADMPNQTSEPELTTGRAALIALVDGYLKGLLDPNVTLLEIHKLMYFLQEAGQDLKLKYEAQLYGPYARNLRHVLNRLEGHMLTGFGDGSDRPDKPMELVQGAVEKASTYLTEDVHTLARMARVQKLIEGFEDPYGLEVLSSVHWVMCHDHQARDSAEEAVKAVMNWNERKRKLIKPAHIEAAWQRLHHEKWATESRSSIH